MINIMGSQALTKPENNWFGKTVLDRKIKFLVSKKNSNKDSKYNMCFLIC